MALKEFDPHITAGRLAGKHEGEERNHGSPERLNNKDRQIKYIRI
jgi:hypothetical protein